MRNCVTIIDYGMGNMGSIANMLRRNQIEVNISSDPDQIGHATKLILPGVGSFDAGMRHLSESGVREIVQRKVLGDGTPILGICLGMQLLFEGSEEGKEPGLGILKGRFWKFPVVHGGTRFVVPHMGWNFVKPVGECRLAEGLEENARFYFVHSYYLPEAPASAKGVFMAEYGCRFVAGVEIDTVCGVQFHPEKSHRWGVRLLGNFARL
jgi:glutamine amidotransferase